MLIEFSVGNYRSFDETVTISMGAAKLSSKDKTLDENNIFNAPAGPALLTSAAIYGANASGKSNLIAAMRFMRQFVSNSQASTKAIGDIEADAFRLRADNTLKPSHFEAVFIADEMRYRYGFELTHQRVTSEWLYFVPSSREARLFVRTNDTIKLGPAFRAEGKDVFHLTRPNALFLSVVAQFNGAIAQKLVQWFRNITIVSSFDDLWHTMRAKSLWEYEFGGQSDAIVALIKQLDLGIDNIIVEKIAPTDKLTIPEALPEELRLALRTLISDPRNETFTIKTVHRVHDHNGEETRRELFDLDYHESEGTRKLFTLAGVLITVLRAGRLLVIDELDARLHPLLTREIVSLFNSPVNTRHAQLIFTTQDTNLLDNRLLRRDQIWFTEKNRQAATQLYSLIEFRIRNDQVFERNYIQGRYGAIPFLGDIKQVMEAS